MMINDKLYRFPHQRTEIFGTLCDRYSNTRLLEINSHSLFYRWSSESGKLVQNLFNAVGEMVEDEDDFIVLLIGSTFSSIYAFRVWVFDWIIILR